MKKELIQLKKHDIEASSKYWHHLVGDVIRGPVWGEDADLLIYDEMIDRLAQAADKTLSDFRTMPEIDRVIFNKPATIVFWKDGTKTVVKACAKKDKFKKEQGLAMAIAKKYYADNRSQFLKAVEEATVQEKEK